ncbi:hypothetical protein [Streptomyces sp. NPDC056190]|uniref:hypothetical protein n=1 Tax=unclassified Streptomyces TaxID=2593676 RepID=UPI0035D79AAC
MVGLRVGAAQPNSGLEETFSPGFSAPAPPCSPQRHRDDDTYAGALHAPPGTVVVFRTDALCLTQPRNWPHHHQPGGYLLRGHFAGPLAAPVTEEELLTLRDAGRAALTDGQEA